MDQPAPRMHLASLLQALLSALGLALCVVGAGAMAAAGLILTGSGQPFLSEQAGLFITLAWTLAFLAVVALPSLILASRRIAGRPTQPPARAAGLRTASLALLLWPPVLALGRVLSVQTGAAAYLLPPLQIVAVVLPLWWLAALALHRLPVPSPQRAWGVLNFSLFFSTPLVILVEVALFLVVLLGVVAVISGQPGLQSQFEEFSQRILNSTSDPQVLLRVYRPILAQPWFIFSLLAGISGLVPLVEELLKPLAVWVFSARKLTPAEGFALGALAGAGFALIETLFSLASPAGSSWLEMAVGRAGTGLLHITTAAFMGCALADAWQSSRYLRLAATYFAVATLHGVWNAFSVLSAYTQLLAGKTGLLHLLERLGTIAPYVLGFLALGMFLALLLTNLRLRASSAASAPLGIAASP